MAPTIAAYEAARYNALPDIRTVVKTLAKTKASELIKGEFKDALKNAASKKFGIILLHSPFYLEGDGVADPPETPVNENEKFVSFGPIALPLDVSQLEPADAAHVVPSVWGFRDGKITPLAFAFAADPAQDALSATDLALFERVQAIVAKHPGAESFGLALLAHAAPGVTAIQGRNAVTLPAAVSKLAPGDERYDGLWAFGDDGEVKVLGVVSGGSLSGHFWCPPACPPGGGYPVCPPSTGYPVGCPPGGGYPGNGTGTGQCNGYGNY